VDDHQYGFITKLKKKPWKYAEAKGKKIRKLMA
jgi:hypothetical protein